MTLVLRLRIFALALALLLAGCAHPPPVQEAGTSPRTSWSGRLALQVEAELAQSFSAGFELKGTALAGELALYNPLGGTLAVLVWSPGTAVLRAEGKYRNFESLDALVANATGTAIPVAALFDWLAGTATPVPGWKPDLSQLANGRLSANRFDPAPAAALRVALDK